MGYDLAGLPRVLAEPVPAPGVRIPGFVAGSKFGL